MPTILNWFLRLIITNPICMRLVQGGSRRPRHLYIRAGYLAVMIVGLLVLMLNASEGGLMRDLASTGASTFMWISYLQLGLICLLTPVFMAGAIAQEANPRTWDILLTTPMSSLQIVLGNLFGRLFFVLVLLFSTLPLMAITQYFGGVPGKAIFESYAIAACSAFIVAAIAVTLSVTRTAGRRAVFLFYLIVVLYLFITYAIDLQLRQPVSTVGDAKLTTIITPLNPFLALEVLLRSHEYVPHMLTEGEASWFVRWWMVRPISAFCWTCVWLSVVLTAISTIWARMVTTTVGSTPWYRKLFKRGAAGQPGDREARRVGRNPVAWRESKGRTNTLQAIVLRWGFVVVGCIVALVLLQLYHNGTFSQQQIRQAISFLLAAEIVIIVLAALNTSATAVSKEREDGTLDLILTTPIQPGPYIYGKLRGLVQFLLPMILVPVLTALFVAVYVWTNGLGKGGVTVTVPQTVNTAMPQIPMILPEAAIAIPMLLVPFSAFAVIVGLHWSIKSKGTIGSVIGAAAWVIGIVGALSLCGFAVADKAPVIGAVFSAFSPVNLVLALCFPEDEIARSLRTSVASGRTALTFGAAAAGVVYVLITIGLHTTMKRNFMMTVRKLAGTN